MMTRNEGDLGPLRDFKDILKLEAAKINARRGKIAGGPPPSDDPETPPTDLVGVGLSGGGIRSASFCLGALQALNAFGVVPRIDYLSTVSGGGYIGASMIACMSENGKFPFGEPSELTDSETVGHIRDNSRYLFPKQADDFLRSVGILARGLAVNVIKVLSVVFLLATLTILANPTIHHLKHSFASDIWLMLGLPKESWPYPYLESRFFLTKASLVVVGLAVTIWALYRSALEQGLIRDRLGKPEYESRWATFAKWAIVVLVITFIGEFQTLIIEWIIDFYLKTKGFEPESIISSIAGLAGASTLLALFRGSLINAIARALDTPTLGAWIKALLAKAVLYIGALVLPLVIYFIYLLISASGIDFASACPSYSTCNALLTEPREFPLRPFFLVGASGTMFYILVATMLFVTGYRAYWKKGGDERSGLGTRLLAKLRRGKAEWLKVVAFLLYLALIVVVAVAVRRDLPGDYWNVLSNFLLFGLIFVVIGEAFAENANALHGLYRDRLNATFRLGRTTNPANSLTLAKIRSDRTPYLLVNATLNARRSKDTSEPQVKDLTTRKLDPARRGRHADFFLFTGDYIGSDSTFYAPTVMKKEDTGKSLDEDVGIDLATAVAISGAAVSSNNGRIGMRALSPTLALLNVRLGYWLDNPKYVFRPPGGIKETWPEVFHMYLLQEAFGWLGTNSKKVYLSDGGHIENIGLYQLLKRRCKVIIIIDAEADPALNFGALADAQRFARIDLGYRVKIEWQPIREQSARRKKAMAEGNPDASDVASEKSSLDHNRHFAIGDIYYSDGTEDENRGVLLYIKANMTGDEPDYVTDYERRYPTFPHESTVDQLFSEEQMEAYRTLGFHSVSRALSLEALEDSPAMYSAITKLKEDLGISGMSL